MPASINGTTPREDTYDWVPLNAWNQYAPRSYNRFLLCFEVPNEIQAAAISHIKSCAVKLGEYHPVLKSSLKVDDPIACMDIAVRYDIPVEVHDIKEKIGVAYAHLKERGFPASEFVGPIFDVAGGGIVHSLILRIYIVDGGLLLGIHLHHTLGDGKAIDNIITWFSAETRGDSYDTRSVLFESVFDRHYDHPGEVADHPLTPEYISQKIPERRLVSTPLSHDRVNSKWTGKIFVFSLTTIVAMQNHLQQLGNVGRPSTSVILMALLWAYTVKARTAASSVPNATAPMHGKPVNDEADHSRLLTIVDARGRVFCEEQSQRYFGNAAEVALAKLPTTDLLKACERTTPVTDLGIVAKQLEPIFRTVQGSIEAVDYNSMFERHVLYVRLPDPRKLIFDLSPEDTRSFVFNSWRYLGMNAGQEWNITGTDGAGYPDAIRRAGGQWNWPAAVFLPTRPGSSELQVMITIEEDAMELLLKDEGLMGGVARVID
ncbi:hypothetical protein GGR55DRAFT_640443 [Xylaria sp. FL0064]|nr:hypothetical protein GGR55DRAFT_640443 [Xylaria sp. FL0064]